MVGLISVATALDHEDILNICGEHIDKEQFGVFEPAVKELNLARIGVKVEEIGLHATTIDKASSEGSADDSEEAEGSLLDDLFGDVDGLDDEEDDGDEDGDRRISEVVSGDWDVEETSPVRAIAEMKNVREAGRRPHLREKEEENR